MPEANRKKSFTLNIALLKSDITSADDAFKDRAGLNGVVIDLGDGVLAELFHKATQAHPPKWVGLFPADAKRELEELKTSSASAVLLVPIEDQLFALTFGFGRFFLKDDVCEENFGLRVVLNVVNPEKLRSIDAQSLDAVSLNTRSQSGVASGISGFGIDIDQDLVCAATGIPKVDGLGKSITGKDALKLSIPISLEELPKRLSEIHAFYNSDEYKANFSWIDQLKQVRSTSLIDRLDSELERKIRETDLERCWIAIPEIVDWADISGFRYDVSNDESPLADIDWDSFIAALPEGFNVTRETLKGHRVLAISQLQDREVQTWPLYKCVYCEVTLDGGEYSLNNGKWYKVNSNFIAAIDAYFAGVPRSDLVLPGYTGNEAAYNRSVHESAPNYYALMDQKNIPHGGGSSKIEFCDLFTADKKLIHVKKYSGSSVLSHLFSQGAVSAKLMLSDPDFRGKVNGYLPDTHKFGDVERKPNASEYEVVFAIATNVPAGKDPNLPLFSKITLRNSVQQIEAYGIPVKLLFLRST